MRFFFLILFLVVCATNISAQSYYGDINHDGIIDIGDVCQLANIVIGNQEKEIYPSNDFFSNYSPKKQKSPLFVDIPDIRNNYTISFSCKISEDFDSINIIRGGSEYSGNILSIRKNDFALYRSEKRLVCREYHNLYLSKYLDVTVDIHDRNATISFSTFNYTFTTNVPWVGSKDGIIIKTYQSYPYVDRFSFSCKDLLKDLWAFGDSYLDYWGQYISNLGYNSMMLDGFSGRISEEALLSLKKDLDITKPTIIFWSLGMNDPDLEDAINPSWLNCIEEVIKLCKEYSIELILTKLPNTPIIFNDWKNKYVTESGYRYVDIYNSVIEDGTTNSWKEGFINPDNIHPSHSGTIAISEQILKDIPEAALY